MSSVARRASAPCRASALRRTGAAWMTSLLAGCGPAAPQVVTASPTATEVPSHEASEAPGRLIQRPKPVVGRLRGFNLQGMYKLEWGKATGFREKDFQIIEALGFNYVRLPLDYKTYTAPGDWYDFLPDKLALIDQAVRWGQQYGVHVSLNLHQAPGYCVHDPKSLDVPKHQQLDLWKDPEAERAFLAHWEMFARRYAAVLPSHLSFNLVNEPGGVNADDYVRVMRRAIQVIRDVTPDRPIELDGLDYGIEPVPALAEADIRHSLHAYEPFGLTHYGASWVPGAREWPVPTWPPSPVPKYLYGSDKPALKSPLVIAGNFPAGSEISVEVAQVSRYAKLSVKAGRASVLTETFRPGPGAGPWHEVVYDQRWKIYQNIYNTRHAATLKKSAAEISLRVTDGDWLTIEQITIKPPGESPIRIQPGISAWGVPQAKYRLEADGSVSATELPVGFEARFEPLGYLDEWIALKQSGQDVIVGELGVYNQTPHAVARRFLDALLQKLSAAQIGWALWDFDGPFGPFDSGRSDVRYESYRGYQLDREMMDLLQKY